MMAPRRSLAGRDGGGAGASAGFLLVEALAAMAISAIILLGLVSSVALMARASERTTQMSEEIEVTSRALDAIARDVRGAAQVRWGGDGGFVFAGSPTGLVFARRYSDAGEMRLIALSTQDGPEHRVLRSQSLLPPDALGPGDVSGIGASQIYAGALAMRFSYFARQPGGQEALLDNWSGGDRMPGAVRVAMIDPATGDIVSSIRIAMMIDAEPGCSAPSTALCSYVVNGEADALDDEDAPRELVDPNDPAGWMRYAR